MEYSSQSKDQTPRMYRMFLLFTLPKINPWLQTRGYVLSTSVNPFPNKPWFLRVYSKSLLKTLWENFPQLSSKSKIVVCKTLSVWKSFVDLKRVKRLQPEHGS